MIWFKLLVALSMSSIFFGCLLGNESSGPGTPAATIHILNGDTVFNGAPLKLWATFEDPIYDSNVIRWKTGFGNIVQRQMDNKEPPIYADTVYLEWNALPPPIFPEAGVTNEFLYFDTVEILNNGVPSKKIVVDIKNLFPMLDSIKVKNGLRVRPKDDSLLLNVQYGSKINLSLFFTDLLKASKMTIHWPQFLLINGQNPELSALDTAYDLGVAPTVSYDRSGIFTVFDGNGASRAWNMRYRTYQETGSIWVGTPSELIKLSKDGFEIFRKNIELTESILLVNNSKLESIYYLDKSQRRIRKFDSRTYNEDFRFSINTLELPHNMVMDGENIWVANEDVLNNSQSRLDKYSASDGEYLEIFTSSIPGVITSLASNRHRSGEIWFLNSVEDKIYQVLGDTINFFVDTVIAHPNLVSFDADEKIVWVSNGKELVFMTINGFVLGRIKGFGAIVSIAAGLGKCWVADRFNSTVYMFDHTVTKVRENTDLNPIEFKKIYRDPVSLKIVYQENPTCWVSDLGNGSLIQLNEEGEVVSEYTGIIAPKIILIN